MNEVKNDIFCGFAAKFCPTDFMVAAHAEEWRLRFCCAWIVYGYVPVPVAYVHGMVTWVVKKSQW
jgi:hypothetical protein